MRLERFDIDCFNNGDWIEKERRYEEDGEYVEWTLELQEAWDKSIATQIYKNGVDEHSGWKIGFCPNSDCSENLSERYDKKILPTLWSEN